MWLRESERDLMAAFLARAPEILGALLDGMVRGVRELPKVNLQSHPRLADFAEWATACEAAFWPPGTFMKAYESNRHHLNEVALDADLVGTTIEAMMATRIDWAGSSADLLRSLNLIADENQTRSKEWPVNANQLGRSLRRCAPYSAAPASTCTSQSADPSRPGLSTSSPWGHYAARAARIAGKPVNQVGTFPCDRGPQCRYDSCCDSWSVDWTRNSVMLKRLTEHDRNSSP